MLRTKQEESVTPGATADTILLFAVAQLCGEYSERNTSVATAGEKDVRIRELEKELRRLTEVSKREDHRSLAKENERLEAEVASSKQELDAQKRLNATLHKASTAAERSQLSMVEELRRVKTEGAKLKSLVAVRRTPPQMTRSCFLFLVTPTQTFDSFMGLIAPLTNRQQRYQPP